MRVTVISPDELGSEEAAIWKAFQEAAPETRNPFLSLTFARAVAASGRKQSRVAVVEENGRIEAFLAFERGPGNIGVPIGWPMNDLHGFVNASSSPVDARQVVRRAGLRAWRFQQVPEGQQALVPHRYPGTTLDCPLIDLTSGFEAYFTEIRSRGKTVVTKSPKQRRALERQLGPVSLVWHSQSVGDELQRLIEWKSAKYERTQHLFADRTARSIVEQLAAATEPDCTGKVSVLYAGDRPVAVDLGLVGPLGLTGWFGGYDPELSRYSPGTMMLLALAEEAAARGIDQFDLGYAQHRYKLLLATSSYPVAGGVVWASRAEALARQLYRSTLLRVVSARRPPSGGPGQPSDAERAGGPPASAA